MNARRLVVALMLLVAGSLLAASARAQGLGDVAARERSKRAEQSPAKKAEAKVFTNDDLNEGKPPGAKTEDETGTPAPSAGESGPAPQSSPAEERRQQERVYLEGINAAQAQLTMVQGRITELSNKLNPMSLSYIYGSGGSNDANEELRVREELRQAESDLQAARQAVVTANQNLQDFRQGRPSGSDEDR